MYRDSPELNVMRMALIHRRFIRSKYLESELESMVRSHGASSIGSLKTSVSVDYLHRKRALHRSISVQPTTCNNHKQHVTRNIFGKRKRRSSDLKQPQIRFIADYPRITPKSQRERHDQAKQVEAKRKCRTVRHTMLFQNVMGRFAERFSTNIIWRNWFSKHKVKHAVFAETKIPKSKINEIAGIPGFKMNAHPAQKVNIAHSSNGMISITANADCTHTHGFMTDIDNKYIMKTINNQLRVVFAGVYVPPWVEGQRRRSLIIDRIFCDLSTLVDAARCIGYRIVIFGDFNARIGFVVGDHAVNDLEYQFLSFIQSNNLRIINKKNHFGKLTCFKNGGGSIIDYVLTDEDPSWNEIYSISMDIPKIRFRCDRGIYSDHQPLLIHLRVDMDRLHRIKSGMPKQAPSSHKVHYPHYRLKITSDPEALSRAAAAFEADLRSDRSFQRELRNLNHFQGTARTSKRARRSRINHLYNTFIHKLHRALIDNGCFERVRCGQSVERDHLLDDPLQELLSKYEAVLNLKGSQYRTQRAHVLWAEIQRRRERVIQREQEAFIERACRYNDDEMESELQRHLKDTFTSGAVIKYHDKLLFDDADIVRYAMDHFYELIGRRRPLHGDRHAVERLQDILSRSFSRDSSPQNALFTVGELQRALKHFPVTKAKGLDMLSYFMLRELSKNNFFLQTLLDVVNAIFVTTTYPDILNVVKMSMLKKRDLVELYDHFRGITIMQNLKSIIHFMRYQRIKEKLDGAVHPNQAAYREGHSPELMLQTVCTAIKQVVHREDRVYLAFTDQDKAFDRMSRTGSLCQMNQIGIEGRCWRLMRDDMDNSSAEIVYRGIHSQQIPVRDGAPQGGVESGPLFNLYMKPSLEKCLSATKTLSYGINASAFSFSDDGVKIASTLRGIQRTINAEIDEMAKWNMGINPDKSKVVKYTRKRDKNAVFENEPDITVNGVSIPWTTRMNIFTFLGFDFDFNKLDFMSTHRTNKVTRFYGVRHSLRFKGRIGGNMPVDIQCKLYSYVRIAFIYGMKIIVFKATHYDDIDKVQRSFLSTIIGCGTKTNSLSIRILLGFPKLSVFLMRLKLLYYYDILHSLGNSGNLFADHQAANYMEMLIAYHLNGDEIKGMKGQWRFDTMDWILCLEQFGLPDIYKDAKCLPFTKAEWRSIVNARYRDIYRSELDTFISSNGRLFEVVFGRRHLDRKRRSKPYSGFLDEMRFLFGGDISTAKISKSIDIMINSTKCNWIHSKAVIPDDGSDTKYCALCDQSRCKCASSHLIWDCPAVRRPVAMQWLRCDDFKENLEFLEQLQLRVDEL